MLIHFANMQICIFHLFLFYWQTEKILWLGRMFHKKFLLLSLCKPPFIVRVCSVTFNLNDAWSICSLHQWRRETISKAESWQLCQSAQWQPELDLLNNNGTDIDNNNYIDIDIGIDIDNGINNDKDKDNENQSRIYWTITTLWARALPANWKYSNSWHLCQVDDINISGLHGWNRICKVHKANDAGRNHPLQVLGYLIKP